VKELKYFVLFCLIGLALIVGFNNAQNRNMEALSPEVKADPLPTVGSYENLKKILENTRNNTVGLMRATDGMMMQEKAETSKSAADLNYSQTNVQVEGVDEADTVKTDGEYIYKIANQRLVVAKAYPPEEMKVISTLSFDQAEIPAEIYVDKQHLVVILHQNSYGLRVAPVGEIETGVSNKRSILPIAPLENSVKVAVYDLGDKANLRLIREIEIDGGYISSRKIDNNLYLVNNKYIPIHILKEQNEDEDQTEQLTPPAYTDSADGGKIHQINYQDIAYFPGSPEANYLIIASIHLADMTDKKTEVKTYLGSGQNIYSSLNALYVAVPEYKYKNTQPLTEPEAKREGIQPSILPMPIAENTSIYKFSLNAGSTEYQGKGSVPGRIINQFSMDEHQGYFRIATTQEAYSPDATSMHNNIFILDSGMQVTGKIENIAPEERIYSVRFLGDKGYMVTFKTVDPLFVLDLKNPYDPQILGELKIPGYSNYLHPYDENHIIGFGKETIEVEQPHWSGQGTVKNAYYLGMKIALFDVSDVNHPKEKYKIEIGDRGTDSELFWNHKALLFSKEKNLMAFPVTVCEIEPTTVDKQDEMVRKDPRLAYGVPVFQGELLYHVSSERGFELKGQITHQPQGKITDLQRTGQYDYNRDISRSLYIQDILYTISNGYIKAHDLISLDEIGGIQILN